MGVGQLSESDAVDALRLPFYSSRHARGSNRRAITLIWGIPGKRNRQRSDQEEQQSETNKGSSPGRQDVRGRPGRVHDVNSREINPGPYPPTVANPGFQIKLTRVQQGLESPSDAPRVQRGTWRRDSRAPVLPMRLSLLSSGRGGPVCSIPKWSNAGDPPPDGELRYPAWSRPDQPVYQS